MAEMAGTLPVAGMAVDRSLVSEAPARRRVAVVTAGWGEDWGERKSVVRAVAGALALESDLSVVSLEEPRQHTGGRPRYDGIFPVYPAAASDDGSGAARLLRAALTRSGEASLGSAGDRLLTSLWRRSFEATALLGELSPDVVVLAGPETLWLARELPVGPARPRIVALPLLGPDPLLGASFFRLLAETTDAIGVFTSGEARLLAGGLSPGAAPLRQVRLSFQVNKTGAAAGMAGMAAFGEYVLVISGWPADDPSARPWLSHDYLRTVVGDVSVAEVRRGRWLVTQAERRYDVPWAASRMNLWRLMSRAVATLDVREAGPVGREAVESLLFATPVVVPAGSPGAEHAASSNGGLWYRDNAEMLEQVRYFVSDRAARERFGRAGQRWAEAEHSDPERAASELCRLVFGEGASGEELEGDAVEDV